MTGKPIAASASRSFACGRRHGISLDAHRRRRRRTTAGACAVRRGSSWRSRAGGGIARIDEGLLAAASRARACSCASKSPAHHQHLAAHFQQLRRASPCRRRSGSERTVRRLGVTSSPTAPSPRVAPCTKQAVLVGERDREAVELELAGVLDRRPLRGPRGSAGRRRSRPRRRRRWRARASARGASPRRSSRWARRRRAASASRALASSGCSASSLSSSWKSASYSASEISGAASL